MCKRADSRAALDDAVITLAGVEFHVLAHRHVFQQAVRADDAARADFCLPPQDGARQDDRARRDLYRVVDEDAVGGIKNNARGQVPLKRCLKCRPALPVCCCLLYTSVYRLRAARLRSHLLSPGFPLPSLYKTVQLMTINRR